MKKVMDPAGKKSTDPTGSGSSSLQKRKKWKKEGENGIIKW